MSLSEFWRQPGKQEALEKLWKEGLSSALIGEQLHTSKNSVISRARRTHLTPRASPIIRSLRLDWSKKSRPKPPRTIFIRSIPPVLKMIAVAAEEQTEVEVEVEADDEPATQRVPLPSDKGCRFPMWGFGVKTGSRPTFCGSVRRDVLCSYCRKHAAICFIRVQRSDAA